MSGLFSTLQLGARSLATQRQGVEVAGHNLANVNNPAYARQRLQIQTSASVSTTTGNLGTGAEVVGIVGIRSAIIDAQISTEASVSGSLEAQQDALNAAQAGLGQQIDQTAGADGLSGSHSIADGLATLFEGFLAVSGNPTSIAERQALLQDAATLATQFHRVDQRLADLSAALNQSLEADVTTANSALADIARLNRQIADAEAGADAPANDLRNLRQQKLEEIARLIKVDAGATPDGSITLSVNGTVLVAGGDVEDSLATTDAGDGRLVLRTATAATAVAPTGGRLQGTLEARDGAVARLRTEIDTLASELISRVNATHATGFGQDGGTGLDFFTGTSASDIGVNAELLENPSRLQAAGTPGAAGDNANATALARLAQQPVARLGNQTFTQAHSRTVSALGEALHAVHRQIDDQKVVDQMLQQQRASVSGVSMDEEMTDLTRFQKAFEASARLITMVDEMLDTLLAMKR